MADRGDDDGIRGGVCDVCELPNFMCEMKPECKRRREAEKDREVAALLEMEDLKKRLAGES